MKSLLKSKICGTHEQCTSALFTEEKSKDVVEGKKKKKGRKTHKRAKHKRAVYPNRY